MDTVKKFLKRFTIKSQNVKSKGDHTGRKEKPKVGLFFKFRFK